MHKKYKTVLIWFFYCTKTVFKSN